MKFVTKTISLKDDELNFAQRKAKQLAKKTGDKPNLSRYVRDLIIRDRDNSKEEAEVSIPKAA